jgi:glucokinase
MTVAPTIGVDVGGSFIKAVLLDEEGSIQDRFGTETPATAAGILDEIVKACTRLGPGLSAGVALAGLVDHSRGVLVWAPHLPGVEVPVAERLADRLGRPVAVDNDANLAALAEHRLGAGRDCTEMLMLTLGTGIGMGIITGGEVIRGRAHAGEIGHVVVDPEGRRCVCGRSGCWETVVSGGRLDADAVEVIGPQATASDLVRSAREGDSAAAERLASAAEWLAHGIEALVLALDPEVVVVGGAASLAGDVLLGPARSRLSHTEGAEHRPLCAVRAGILGADSGAVGAALSARGAS